MQPTTLPDETLLQVPPGFRARAKKRIARERRSYRLKQMARRPITIIICLLGVMYSMLQMTGGSPPPLPAVTVRAAAPPATARAVAAPPLPLAGATKPPVAKEQTVTKKKKTTHPPEVAAQPESAPLPDLPDGVFRFDPKDIPPCNESGARLAREGADSPKDRPCPRVLRAKGAGH